MEKREAIQAGVKRCTRAGNRNKGQAVYASSAMRDPGRRERALVYISRVNEENDSTRWLLEQQQSNKEKASSGDNNILERSGE